MRFLIELYFIKIVDLMHEVSDSVTALIYLSLVNTGILTDERFMKVLSLSKIYTLRIDLFLV